jgi:hypothetical protein
MRLQKNHFYKFRAGTKKFNNEALPLRSKQCLLNFQVIPKLSVQSTKRSSQQGAKKLVANK